MSVETATTHRDKHGSPSSRMHARRTVPARATLDDKVDTFVRIEPADTRLPDSFIRRNCDGERVLD